MNSYLTTFETNEKDELVRFLFFFFFPIELHFVLLFAGFYLFYFFILETWPIVLVFHIVDLKTMEKCLGLLEKRAKE